MDDWSLLAIDDLRPQVWESSSSGPGLETFLLLESEHGFSPVYAYTGPHF